MLVPTPAVTSAIAPAITPAPTASFAALELRQTTSFDYGYSYNADCEGLAAVLTCEGPYLSCLTNIDYNHATDVTALESGYQSCYCQYGLAYLNCFFSALSSSSCADYYGITNWNSYETAWFQSSCGSIPPSIMAQMAPPATVSLELEPVKIVTLNSSLPPPTYTYSPLFQGAGSLLDGECSSTEFTLIDAGSTAFWAPFVGCASDKPQCCPWTAAKNAIPMTVTADTTVTLTTTVGATIPTGQDFNQAFPAPQDSNQGVLAKCADDYYSISGGCCPNGYWPFTTLLGGQTPCWSSLLEATTAPDLTAGLAGEPTDTSKPTSAVVNIVWAMQYPVSSSTKGSLSTGAIAGIAVGTAVAVIAIATLAFCLWRMRRKNRTLQQQQQQQQQQQGSANGAAGGTAAPSAAMQQTAEMDATKGGSVITTSTTPVSMHMHMPMPMHAPTPMLVPQTTGTSVGGAPTVVSELSSTSTAVAPTMTPLGHFGGTGPTTASPVNGGMGAYPAPIAEADEFGSPARVQQQQQQQQQQPMYNTQYQQQQYGVPMQQPGQMIPPQNQMSPPPPGQYYSAAPVQGQGQGQGQQGFMPQQPAMAMGIYPPPQQQQQQQPQVIYYDPVSPNQTGGSTMATATPPQMQQGGYPQPVQQPHQPVAEMSATREAPPPQEMGGAEVQHQPQSQPQLPAPAASQ